MHQRASREEAEQRPANSPPRRWRCPGWCPSRRGGSTRRPRSLSPRPRASPTTAAPSPAPPPPASSPSPETWSGPAPAASTRSAAFSLAKIKTPRSRSVQRTFFLLLLPLLVSRCLVLVVFTGKNRAEAKKEARFV